MCICAIYRYQVPVVDILIDHSFYLCNFKTRIIESKETRRRFLSIVQPSTHHHHHVVDQDDSFRGQVEVTMVGTLTNAAVSNKCGSPPDHLHHDHSPSSSSSSSPANNDTASFQIYGNTTKTVDVVLFFLCRTGTNVVYQIPRSQYYYFYGDRRLELHRGPRKCTIANGYSCHG